MTVYPEAVGSGGGELVPSVRATRHAPSAFGGGEGAYRDAPRTRRSRPAGPGAPAIAARPGRGRGEPGRFSRAHEGDAYGCCVPALTRFASPHCPGPPRLTPTPARHVNVAGTAVASDRDIFGIRSRPRKPTISCRGYHQQA